MQRNPGSETLRIPGHSSVVLMSVNDAAIEPGEDKAHRGPRMDEQFPPCQQLHHVLQQGLMREAVKRFEREDKLIDFFVSGVSVGTRRRLDSSPVDRIYVCIGPASDFQDRRDFAQRRSVSSVGSRPLMRA